MRAIMAMVFGALAAFPRPAAADNAPVLVIPSRPGVPVIVNGIDVSYAVLDGDWGLYRPGAVPVTISRGALLGPAPVIGYGYFPRTGRPPRVGRLEVQPPANRPLPAPAETYYRSWSTNDFGPPPAAAPAAPAAPVIVEPQIEVPLQRRPRR